jgi:hypothetical protein
MARRQGFFDESLIIGSKLPWRVATFSTVRFRRSSRGCRPDVLTRHGNHSWLPLPPKHVQVTDYP